MRFSIITITFNAEKYLRETLTSVAEQNFSDFEHIVWDGGSKDGTLDIVASFPHVKLFQGKDSGISDAMNKGASFAGGEFLLHLHADDVLAHPKVLSVIDTSLKHHPQIEWLYGQVAVIDEKGREKSLPPFRPFKHQRLKKYNCIAHPATLVSRKFFLQSGGFDASLRYCMDYDLWLRLARSSCPFALPHVLSHFREHENSLSTSLPLEVAKEAYLVRNRYLKTLLEKWRSYKTFKKRSRRANNQMRVI